MPKPRGATSYRLSGEAQQYLEMLASRLGLTKTSVLEMSIRKLAYAELGEDVPPTPAPRQAAVAIGLAQQNKN